MSYDFNKIRKQAIEYTQKGLMCLPSTYNEKKPIVRYQNLKKISVGTTANYFDQYAGKRPGIAILTGERSNGLVVIDIDNKNENNGFKSIQEWERQHGFFPETWQVETPSGGIHLYYYAKGQYKTRQGVLEGVDIRAEGGLAIAPPTERGGIPYTFVAHDLPIAEANESVLKLLELRDRKKENLLPQESNINKTPSDTVTVNEGERTSYLVSIIGQQNFKGNKINKEHLKSMIREVNQTDCNPPLTDQELEKEVFPAIDNLMPYEKKSKQESPPQKLILMSGQQLQELEMPPLEWLVDDYLPLSGVCGIIGSPKSRKSFMALDLCISIANGSKFLGKNTHKVDTLYFDLESGLRRPKERQDLILARQKAPDNFYIITSEQEVKQLDNGFIDQLTEILENNRNIRFVVIDTLGILRGAKKTDYSLDVDDIKKLKDICTKYDICIMVIHHFKKGRGEKNGDIFERISGTNGIFGTMDTSWLIDAERGTTFAQFHVSGRDIREHDMIIDFDEKIMKWEYKGTKAEMEEARAQNAYENDPITLTIKYILEKNPDGWTGTAQDIKDYSIELPKSIDVTTQQIGRFISNNVSRFKKDNIRIEREKRQSSRYYHINKF